MLEENERKRATVLEIKTSWTRLKRAAGAESKWLLTSNREILLVATGYIDSPRVQLLMDSKRMWKKNFSFPTGQKIPFSRVAISLDWRVKIAVFDGVLTAWDFPHFLEENVLKQFHLMQCYWRNNIVYHWVEIIWKKVNKLRPISKLKNWELGPEGILWEL